MYITDEFSCVAYFNYFNFSLVYIAYGRFDRNDILLHKRACIYEPPRGKTNNVVSEQVWHKSGCTVTEDSQKHEISYLGSRGIVLSV